VEPVSPAQRAALNVRRLFAIVVSQIQRVLGVLLQIARRDQLKELTDQTHRLSSASVESITHVGGELRALDERLDRIEQQLADQGRTLDELRTREPDQAGETAAERHQG
jgi:hypothetical protein